jgi:hypothetical protein
LLDKNLFLLSSLGEIYLIEKISSNPLAALSTLPFSNHPNHQIYSTATSQITADRLIRPASNFLYSLLETGIKLFGVSAPNQSASNSMISAASNSFLVVMSELALMISLGANNANGGLNLTLWENYDRIGEEKVLYDIPQFAVSLKQDIAKQLSSSAHESVSPENVRISILDSTYNQLNLLQN